MNIFNNIDNFIFPVFIYENETTYQNSLKLQYMNESKVFIKNISGYVQKLVDLKIYNMLIFGIPTKRNSLGNIIFWQKWSCPNFSQKDKGKFW